MKRDRHAGREYAEIWAEAVQANRRLRTILIFLSQAASSASWSCCGSRAPSRRVPSWSA